MGMMVDDNGGDMGRCGGGVTDTARGVACPDEFGDRTGDKLRGEYTPFGCSDAVGEPAEMGLFSTSLSSDDKKVLL